MDLEIKVMINVKGFGWEQQWYKHLYESVYNLTITFNAVTGKRLVFYCVIICLSLPF